METYLFQTVVFQKDVEVLRQKIGLDQFSDGVHIDVLQIILTVCITAYPLIDFLLLQKPMKQVLKWRHQR